MDKMYSVQFFWPTLYTSNEISTGCNKKYAIKIFWLFLGSVLAFHYEILHIY